MTDAGPIGKLTGIKLLDGLTTKELAEIEQVATWRRHPSQTQVLDRASTAPSTTKKTSRLVLARSRT